MNIQVVVSLRVEGFHRWPEAPLSVDFLCTRHRHIFHIKAWKTVTHGDRDVEIITLKREIEGRLSLGHGTPCEFGPMSCEHIATWLIEMCDLDRVEVLEDGENGGVVSK